MAVLTEKPMMAEMTEEVDGSDDRGSDCGNGEDGNDGDDGDDGRRWR